MLKDYNNSNNLESELINGTMTRTKTPERSLGVYDEILYMTNIAY